MPDYLESFEIDWSWPQLDADEREVAKRVDAELQADATSFTVLTLCEAVARESLQVPSHDIKILARTESKQQHAVKVREGDWEDIDPASFSPAGRVPK